MEVVCYRRQSDRMFSSMLLPPYSVLMSVYSKERAAYLHESLTSILNQTVFPAEIVLVKDGPLTEELEAVINSFIYQHEGLFRLVEYPEYALAQGVSACNNEIIVRMDSDDYAFPSRVEKQLSLMLNKKLDMVGSQVTEFIDNPDNPISKSALPTTPDEIRSYSKKRNPFRHPSMVLKRTRVLAVGNYSSDFLYFEDWDLFNRMLAAGCKADNIDEILVAMRVSPDYYNRRGGVSYIPHIWKFKTTQLKRGYFTFGEFLISTIPHVVVCLVPNSVRSFIYTRLLRRGN